MAQNITIMGASYLAVPGVQLPKTGGGTALFTDVSSTTATAADVSSGKIFFDAAGNQTTGTNSGGGGASNFVHGTFTTESSAGAYSITIPYTGNGHPIAAIVVIDGGACNSAYSHWYDSVQRYAVGQWTMTKSVMSSNPTYTTSGTQNQGVTTAIYKNSTSTSTSYSRTSGMNTNVFSSYKAANAATTCVRFRSDTTLSYYVNTSSYGLLPETDYEYFIVYSE